MANIVNINKVFDKFLPALKIPNIASPPFLSLKR